MAQQQQNGYRFHFKADAAEQAHDDEIRPADYRKDKKGERNGGGRLLACLLYTSRCV